MNFYIYMIYIYLYTYVGIYMIFNAALNYFDSKHKDNPTRESNLVIVIQ